MRATRPCTRVFFEDFEADEEITFEVRHFQVIKEFESKPFKSNKEVGVDQTEAMLLSKQKELKELKELLKGEDAKEPRRTKPTWKQKVDRQRALVAEYLTAQPTANLADVQRFTGCCYSLAKRVQKEVSFSGEPPPYRPPNLKNPHLVAELQDSIARVQGTFTTVTDLKRKHPSFSRKWIARLLHTTGHRYHKMPKKRRVAKKERYRKREVLETVTHLAQALANSHDVETYYIDEVHFMFEQTTERCWTKPGTNLDPVYHNKRPSNDIKVSAIAICDLRRFLAVQFFTQEIVANDFLYFLQQVLQHVSTKSKITVLADNASWHTAASISSTAALKFVHFNAPGLFQSNAIENCFSFVKADFRKRPLMHDVYEETRHLVKVFFDDQNYNRFAGVARNHLRSLLDLLSYNYMALATKESSDED